MRRLILASLLLLLASGAAYADEYDCPGTLVGHKNVYSSGSNPTKIGELQVYWSESRGKNCVRFMHAGRTWGVPRYTGVSLGICRNRQDRLCNHIENDPNADPVYGRSFRADVEPNYRYQAGPTEVDRSTRGKCIRAAGYIRDKGQDRKAVLYGFCN